MHLQAASCKLQATTIKKNKNLKKVNIKEIQQANNKKISKII